MNILVTGTAGFIGCEVALKLLTERNAVVGIDNHNDYYDPKLKESRLRRLQAFANYSHHRVDIADASRFAALFDAYQPDIVIHLAAQAGVRYSLEHPEAYVHSNLEGFVNVLENCRHHHIRHLIFASSSSVYGLNHEQPYAVKRGVDHPISLYAATKKSNELMAHTYAHLYGLPVTGLRFFTVYGPWGRPDMAYFKFTERIIRGQAIDIYNHGSCERDFTYIDDIVEGVLRVAERPATACPVWDGIDPSRSSAPYRIYNIGNHRPVKLMRFVEILEDLIGIRAEKRLLPAQPGDVASTYADITDLVNETGYSPSTDLETGLGRFWDWYQGYYQFGMNGEWM